MSDPAVLALFPPFPEGIDPSAMTGAAGAMGDAEGGDRASLRLRPIDEEIIAATVAANPRTVVVIVTAGAVVMENWRNDVPAVLVGWYSGVEGGLALADVLTGAVDAGGRLPYSIPTTEDHLPFFDRDARTIVYDRWFGQRLLDRDGHAAAYPLGFGLSYTTFSIEDIELSSREGESIVASVRVRNTGGLAGRHVVQLYGSTEAADFPSRVLLGFRPVDLDPGEEAVVEVQGSLRPLQRWEDGGFVWSAPDAMIAAAAYSGDPLAVSTTLELA